MMQLLEAGTVTGSRYLANAPALRTLWFGKMWNRSATCRPTRAATSWSTRVRRRRVGRADCSEPTRRPRRRPQSLHVFRDLGWSTQIHGERGDRDIG